MTSRADVVGSPSGTATKGAPQQQIVLRCYRAIISVSKVLILLHRLCTVKACQRWRLVHENRARGGSRGPCGALG
jgi:hypothetical protein